MNIVCFTCITGGYDSLKQPLARCPGVDFVCFSDNMFLSGGYWQVRPIPDEVKMFDKGKQQRIIKICPHRWLSNYDVSVWVDGSIQVCKDISTFIS